MTFPRAPVTSQVTVAVLWALAALACSDHGAAGADAGADASGDGGADADADACADAGSGPGSDANTDDASRGCVPVPCATLRYTCGEIPDSCGGILYCGTCTAPEYCGGGGFDRCGSGDAGGGDGEAGMCPGCRPATCASLAYDCGVATDGCGGLLDCGTCKSPAWCGGGGFNVCGGGKGTDAEACIRLDCAQQNVSCGETGDGCGNRIECGRCLPPGVCCGGSSLRGQCGLPTDGQCTPLTCVAQHLACGPASDGCGNLLDCGTCQGPLACGGLGVPGQCGQGHQ